MAVFYDWLHEYAIISINKETVSGFCFCGSRIYFAPEEERLVFLKPVVQFLFTYDMLKGFLYKCYAIMSAKNSKICIFFFVMNHQNTGFSCG